MNETMTIELTPQMLAVIPILAMVLEMVKGIAPLAWLKPWMPFVAVGLSFGAAVLFGIGSTLEQQVIAGVLMGLATSGGYDAVRVPTKIQEKSGNGTQPPVTP